MIFYPHYPWDSQSRNTWQLLLCTSSIVTPLPKLPTLSFICPAAVIWGQRTPDSSPTTSADILRRSLGRRDQNFFRDLHVAYVPPTDSLHRLHHPCKNTSSSPRVFSSPFNFNFRMRSSATVSMHQRVQSLYSTHLQLPWAATTCGSSATSTKVPRIGQGHWIWSQFNTCSLQDHFSQQC